MNVKLKIPKSSAASEHCELIEWCVQVGDEIEKGQALYVLESEKATVDVPSPMKGVVISLAEAGKTYAVGSEVAVIKADFG